MNRIFTNIQRKLFKKQIDNLNKCFIVSTGRTGTLFFESFLNSVNSQIACVHEPKPDLYDLAIDKYRWQLDQNKLNEVLIKSRNNYLIKAIKDKKSCYVESNNNLAFLVEDIANIYGNVKFIVLVRDPRTYVVSALNKSPLNNNKFTFYGVEDHRDRLKPSDFENDPYLDTWDDLKRFEKIGWFWNKCNRLLYDFHTSFSKSLLIKYEDLFAQDLQIRKSTFLKVIRFLDEEVIDNDLDDLLKATYKKANKTIQEETPDFSDWTKSDQEYLLRITQPMRVVLNY